MPKKSTNKSAIERKKDSVKNNKKNEVAEQKASKNESKKTIKTKNYIILILSFIATTLVSIYLCDVYSVYEENKKQISVISEVLNEIKSEELEHYISENPTTMMYMCTASNQTCRSYEKDLKKLVLKENLQDLLIYLNISEEEKDSLIKNINEKYSLRLKIKNEYPIIVIFEDGKITHLLQPKDSEKLTITKTKQFIDLHRLGD